MLSLAFASWVSYGDIKSPCMIYDKRVAMKLSGEQKRLGGDMGKEDMLNIQS